MRKIIVLDGETLNPGDLDWTLLNRYGEVTVYSNSSAELVLERCEGAEIVLTNKVVLDASLLVQLPQLRYIGVTATGYNVVDVNAAAAQGVVVTNIPGYGPESVAQMAMAHLLHFASRVAQHDDAVHQGQWVDSPNFCFWNAPLMALAGKTLGVVGFGDIGQAMARMARGFGMKVLVHTRSERHDLPTEHRWVTLAELFSQADVVSLHCPQTAANTEFVNAQLLATMKPTALLLNTARGGLIHEAELAQALAAGVIAGAGLDVLSTEPPAADNPLLTAPNCSITPHNAWATLEARQNLLNIAIANIGSYLNGKVQHQVN
ncbi:D-2-hydroxyacid dehydrogenase [Ferrimonas lipolytica]|uniref:D-2-hydroxyacid dehydrogenase n=1 Tax=Ferrimonas lipolytica TaxID=2724191 RepID=A0A6H1UFD9_9GAMM|nr:D-2-hydroxyacid dehydrogenase [Ferrimonas lipolytica]QIZ77817.1 D-2-hydroxyacid dehydrogenase [Ferrimonas lipolytica]